MMFSCFVFLLSACIFPFRSLNYELLDFVVNAIWLGLLSNHLRIFVKITPKAESSLFTVIYEIK